MKNAVIQNKQYKIFLSCIFALLLGSTAYAQVPSPRMAILSWTVPTTRANNDPMSNQLVSALIYRYFVGAQSGTYTHSRDVLSPVPLPSGQLQSAVELPFSVETNLFFAMKACIPAGFLDPLTGRTEPSENCSSYSTEVQQAGKIKLAPPGTPEIIGQGILGEYFEYTVFAMNEGETVYNDENGNAVVPVAMLNILAERHPELKTGELQIYYQPTK